MLRLLLGLAVLALGTGCQKAPPSSPDVAYRAFVRAAQQNPEAAFSSLSQATQDQMRARAKSLSGESGKAVREAPAQLLFSGLQRPAEIKDLRVLRQDDHQALLEVVTTAGTTQVTLLKEQGGWRVDFAAQLAARQGAPAP